MKKDYGDILYREHPQSAHRPPMPLRDRAAQFSPFAALSGYEAVLAECARYTETRPELAGDEQALLDEKLRPCLEQAIAEKRKAAARDAAGTKVNFFTFVRGEDQ